jgi:hypothetical protein
MVVAAADAVGFDRLVFEDVSVIRHRESSEISGQKTVDSEQLTVDGKSQQPGLLSVDLPPRARENNDWSRRNWNPGAGNQTAGIPRTTGRSSLRP